MTATVAAGYEKVTCEPCKGTGRVPKGQGFYTWKSDRRRKPRCHECGGSGWLAVRIKNAPKCA